MASPDSPKRGSGAFVIGCVLGLVFIGGGALVVTVGGGFAAAYLWRPAAPPAGGALSLHNPGNVDIDVTCSGDGREATATVAAGATAVVMIAGVPVECSGKAAGEDVWNWSADEGTTWSEELPLAPTVDPAAVDPAAAAAGGVPADDLAADGVPTDPSAAATDAATTTPGTDAAASAPPGTATATTTTTTTTATPSTTGSTSSKTTTTKATTSTTTKTTTSTTKATAAAPATTTTSASATTTTTRTSAAAPTKVSVSFAKKAKKEKGLSVWLDGKSLGPLPVETTVALGMHTVAIVGTAHAGSVNKSCSIAASGADWSWSFDAEAPACP